jgi:hypothetical protein
MEYHRGDYGYSTPGATIELDKDLAKNMQRVLKLYQ